MFTWLGFHVFDEDCNTLVTTKSTRAERVTLCVTGPFTRLQLEAGLEPTTDVNHLSSHLTMLICMQVLLADALVGGLLTPAQLGALEPAGEKVAAGSPMAQGLHTVAAAGGWTKFQTLLAACHQVAQVCICISQQQTIDASLSLKKRFFHV